MKTIAVEDRPGLVRDMNTGAILNINTNEIKTARALKAKRKEDTQRQVTLESDVRFLRHEMNELKNLLKQLIEK
jgi:hypothetical protein